MPPPTTYTVPTRLYHTRDRQRVVAEGDPDAAFLLAGAGAVLTEFEARQRGLLDYLTDHARQVRAAEDRHADERDARAEADAETRVRFSAQTGRSLEPEDVPAQRVARGRASSEADARAPAARSEPSERRRSRDRDKE